MKYAFLLFLACFIFVPQLFAAEGDVTKHYYISCLDLTRGPVESESSMAIWHKKPDESYEWVQYTGRDSKACGDTFRAKCINKSDLSDCAKKEYNVEKGWSMVQSTCNVITDSYANEALNFSSPHIVQLKSKTTSPFLPTIPVGVLRSHGKLDLDSALPESLRCATFLNKESTCHPLLISSLGILAQAGTDERLIVVDDPSYQQILPDAQGAVYLPHVESYTSANIDHFFYGIQPLGAGESEEEPGVIPEASDLSNDQSGLKLGTFDVPQPTPLSTPQNVPEGETNCNRITWDPSGKTIDVTSLLPVQDSVLELQTSEGNTWKIAGTINKNPGKTRFTGLYNFYPIESLANKDTTYRFNIQAPEGYVFPANPQKVTRALDELAIIDPTGAYFDGNRLYNKDDVFVEKARTVEEKFIFLEPINQNVSTITLPARVDTIAWLNGTDQTGNQVIRGYTWPKASVTATYNDTSTTTRAEIDGYFEIIFPGSILQNTTTLSEFSIVAQPTMITQNKLPLAQILDKNPLARLLLFLSDPVYAASPASATTVEPLLSTLGGFVFNNSLKIAPKSRVELIIPSLGGIVYASTTADENGYVFVSKEYVPNMPFDVRISQGGKPISQFSSNEFVVLNNKFIQETKFNPFIPVAKSESPIEVKPEVIKAVQAAEPVSPVERAQITQNSRERIRLFQAQAAAQKIAGSAGQQNPTTPANASQSANNPFALFFIVLVMIGVPFAAAFIYFRMKTRSQL